MGAGHLSQGDVGQVADYLQPFARAIDLHGATFKATMWNSPRTQEVRFEVLTSMMGLRAQGAVRLADVGCGPGALAGWLMRQGFSPAAYLGIDALPEFIEAARRAAPTWAEFAVGDPLADSSPLRKWQPDWIIISGTLNTMSQEQAELLLEACFDSARVGVAFNFLSDWCSIEQRLAGCGPARRLDTQRLLDLARRHTPRVAFEQRYLDGHDAAIAAERSSSSRAAPAMP